MNRYLFLLFVCLLGLCGCGSSNDCGCNTGCECNSGCGCNDNVCGTTAARSIGNIACQCCETNGYSFFDKIAFWKTPVAEGGKYVPYSRWTQDYIAIMGGR